MDSIEITVLQCLQDNYGLEGHLQRLPGENLNYLLTTLDGGRHVIKIVDDDMPAAVTKMEFAAIEYAKSVGLSLDLPIINDNKYGNIDTGIKIHINKLHSLKVLNFVSGTTLDDIPDISDKLIENLGFTLATFHQAMSGFDHSAAHRSHRWNLTEAGQHAKKAELLEDPEKQSLLAWGFDRWEAVRNCLDSLPWQFIHGDFNPENLMVKGDRVTGLVDFGDACYNPAACDLAICLTYPMMDSKNPMRVMQLLLAGYQEARSLGEAEQRILLPLVAGRLATSIAVATQRRGIDPDNPNWFGGEVKAWGLLRYIKNRAQMDPLF